MIQFIQDLRELVDQWRWSRKKLTEFGHRTAFFRRKDGSITTVNLPVLYSTIQLPEVCGRMVSEGEMPDVPKVINYRLAASMNTGAFYEEAP